jgi:hypothetical protein
MAWRQNPGCPPDSVGGITTPRAEIVLTVRSAEEEVAEAISSRPVATRKDETADPVFLSPTNPWPVIAVTDF